MRGQESIEACGASQALEAAGARRLWNESFFSAPQLKRDPLGADMKHQPATTLPSDNESWWSTVDEFTNRETALVRQLDWAGAERLAREYFEKAESAYAAALFAQSRATSLAALGRDTESLEASELAERLAPLEPYFKLNLARRLTGEFG